MTTHKPTKLQRTSNTIFTLSAVGALSVPIVLLNYYFQIIEDSYGYGAFVWLVFAPPIVVILSLAHLVTFFVCLAKSGVSRLQWVYFIFSLTFLLAAFITITIILGG